MTLTAQVGSRPVPNKPGRHGQNRKEKIMETIIPNGALEIVILDKGWVFVGNVSIADEWIVIENARNIRRWGTTNGIGQLAIYGPQTETILDDAGTVKFPMSSLIARIKCEESEWTK